MIRDPWVGRKQKKLEGRRERGFENQRGKQERLVVLKIF